MTDTLALFVFSLLLVEALANTGATYEYQDPNLWPDEYKTCATDGQSPINIVTSQVEFNNTGPLMYEGYHHVPDGMEWSFSNTGDYVKMVVGDGYAISGGSLPGRYLMHSFHFHWGSADDHGSEHEVDYQTFPMEMHLVHYNDKYPSITEAQDKKDGIAVLGFFFQIVDFDNPNMELIIDALNGKLHYKGDSMDFTPFPIAWLLPSDLSQYFRYYGSLTTPPCYESVVWTLMNYVIPISHEQMATFREEFFQTATSDEKDHMVNNYRPVQKKNGREVTSSFVLDSYLPSYDGRAYEYGRANHIRNLLKKIFTQRIGANSDKTEADN